MKLLNKILSAVLLVIVSSTAHSTTLPPDEGMFPLSELKNIPLQKAGLKIKPTDIYNPGKVGLVDALVSISGCTGSFVSNNGLIITNHHCAFSAVQQASTAINNYLKNGFVAQSHEQEIEAKGLSIRITDSYEDVSDIILSAVASISDPVERIKKIKEKQQELIKEAQAKDPGIKAEVSEMFIGKTYVLFRYKTIQDVRLVYIPRQNIGEFGGETDNWMWPRHTGDFSFIRAYVSKDGKPTPYSKDNVPYSPKKFLKINARGVNQNDFIFILGYPGRTFRNRPAEYIQYQQNYLLPYVSDLYDFQNNQMLVAGRDNTDTALSLATRIKRNANVLKNYRGKLKGLRNIDLISIKQNEDAKLNSFIQSKTELKAKYGTLMADIVQYYAQVDQDALKELWLNNIYSSTSTLQIARYINTFKAALNQQTTAAGKQALFANNTAKIKSDLAGIYESFNETVDKNIFGRMLLDASKFTNGNQLSTLKTYGVTPENANAIAEDLISKSQLANKQFVLNNLTASLKNMEEYEDQLLRFQQILNAENIQFAQILQRREGELNKLMGEYVAVKELFQNKNFIPDANSTLRLTFGKIKGYSPADATIMEPFSTIAGIIQKGNSGNEEYDYPEAIKSAWQSKNFGPYVKKELQDVPVNMLYDTDTTGGNSGSPIMNAYGELIGVNFDRTYDATINDFAWNESYSRSIGVDIRYVLWVADKIDNAQFILKELGV